MKRFLERQCQAFLKVIELFWLLVFKIYSLVFSPLIHAVFFYLNGGVVGCRFSETCSCYMKRQISEKGTIRGIVYGFIRVFRCNPFFSPKK